MYSDLERNSETKAQSSIECAHPVMGVGEMTHSNQLQLAGDQESEVTVLAVPLNSLSNLEI